MRLCDVLFSQGFGTRRECNGLIEAGWVQIQGQLCDNPFELVDPIGLNFTVQGQTWLYQFQALLMLNKPTGYECSQKPRHHLSVYSLLPAPLRRRNVQTIGRLDEDTTGLLLLTDQGSLIHKLTSPKFHVPKVYEVGCKHPLLPQQLEELRNGVTLIDDPHPVRAADVQLMERTDELHGLQLTLTEGKYHQVKRMVAAVGNRVERLHRSRFGPLTIPVDLAPGQWCWLNPQELAW
jgi:16S rRNA pseudouridine516 synthase